MVAGNWYLWDGTAWISGGVYNSVAVQSDTELNDFSTNPVQNKVIKAALDQIEGAIPEIDATLSVSGKAADAKKTGDEISGLKEDLNNALDDITDDVVTDYSVGSYGGSGSYWFINNNKPQMEKGKTYRIVITPNATFSLDDIKAGTSGSFSAMVDTIAENVSFTANVAQSFDYTPSQNGIRYIRFYESGGNISSIVVKTVNKELKGPYVKYNAATVLTDTEKETARNNIDAASKDDIASVNAEVAELDERFETDKYEWYTYASAGDSNYRIINASRPQLIEGHKYHLVLKANATATVTAIQMGTSTTSASMVDTIAENVTLVAGQTVDLEYTPTQSGMRYIRMYSGAANKVDTSIFYEVSKVSADMTDDSAERGMYALANRINTGLAEIKALRNVVDSAVNGMLSVSNAEPTTKTITLPSVGEKDKAFVRIGMHYGSPAFTPDASDVFFNESCKTDFSDVRFFDANGNLLKAQLSKPVNLDLLKDNKLDGYLHHLSDGTLIKYVEADGIMWSQNSGATWTAISGTAAVTEHGSAVYNRKSMYPVFVDGSDNIFAYAGGILYKLLASDSYATKTEVLDFSWDNDGTTIYPDIQNHAMVADGNGNLIVGACYQEQYHTNVYRSTDGGNTFTLCWYHYGGNEYQHVHNVSYDPFNDKIYVQIDDGGYTFIGSRIIVSEDGGANWTEITNAITNHQVRGRDYYPTYFGDGTYRLGGGETYIMGAATIYRSEDDVHYDYAVNGVAGVRSFSDFGDDSLIITGSQDSVVAHENHVFISTDKGKTWDSIARYYQPVSASSGVGWRNVHSAFTPYGESTPCVVMPKDTGNVPTLRVYKGGNNYYREAYIMLENTEDSQIVITAKTGYAMEYPYKSLQESVNDHLIYEIPLNECGGRYVRDSIGNVAKITGQYRWENVNAVRFGDYAGRSTMLPNAPSGALCLNAKSALNFGKIKELDFADGYTVSFWLNTKARLMDADNYDNYMQRTYELFSVGNVTFIQKYNLFGYAVSANYVGILENSFSLMYAQRPSFLYSDQYWFVVIAVGSDKKVTIYVNGEKGGSNSNSLTGVTLSKLSQGDFVVGNSYYDSGAYISDIKVYDKVFTDAEILDMYRGM